MNKIIIIGGGFSGLSAAKQLSSSKLNPQVILIDKKEGFDFLPMLPDVIGRGIDPPFLTYKIEDISKKYGFKFINEEVISVDLERREVFSTRQNLAYDYLLIASGSETNFYGNDNIKNYAWRLDGIDDVKRIADALRKNEFDNFIVGGGGYTGVEVAANLRLFLDKIKVAKRIIIVERTPVILGPLPDWIKEYVSGNLQRLKVDIFTNSAIEKIEGGRVYLSAGLVFDNALVIWAAGVKTANFIQNLKAEKNPQGRLKVDDYLRLDDTCFAAGDAAYFSDKGIYLRMAVQFAIYEGRYAAVNIINSIKGIPLRRYRPRDLGYIIPMANNRSCGVVLGFNLKGLLPTLFHFIMCIWRSYGLKNKFGIIKGLITGGVK